MQNKNLNTSFKIARYFISLLTVATFYTGCKKKDLCADVICLNGGVCVDGTCKCPGGYSGPNCENYDPCYNITCLNGGTCANGSCNCPTGYTGSNCGTALPLKSVTITRIVVNNFPRTLRIGQIGYNWDPGTTLSRYPDIYINIKPGTSSIAEQTSAVYPNVDSAPQTYSFVPVTLNNPSGNYTIGLYDYDPSDSDDHMGGIYFKPSDYKAGYPQTIHVYNSAIYIDYTVYVIWNF